MNDECPFYRVDRKELRSREIRADRMQDVQIVRIPWCGHPKHTPVTRQDTRVLGGARLLQCGGDLGRCPLTDEQFEDME